MIQPSQCQATAASSWVKISHTLYNGFTQPHLVLAILVAIAFLGLCLPKRRWKRFTLALSGGLMVLYLMVLTPAVAQLGNRFLSALLPHDPGQPVDAIVVLGRGTKLRPQRVDVATELWQQQRAPLIFISGRGDAPKMATMLKQKGVPAQAIDGEPCSSTTEENAQFTAAILQPRGVHRILLVTDPPHMLRSQLTFQSLGFEVTPHTSPLPHRFKKPGDGLVVFREWVGLVAYGLMGRYFSRHVEPGAPFTSQAAVPPSPQPRIAPLASPTGRT